MVGLHLRRALAADGAGEARPVRHQIRRAVGTAHLRHRVGAQVAGALELHVLVVAGRQAAEGLGHVDHGERTRAREVGAGLARGKRAGGLLHGAGEGVIVVHRDAPGAAHRDGLQVLRSHDGTDAGAPGRPVEIVHHAGVAVQVLPCPADGGDPDRAVLMTRLDRGLGIPDRLAPDEAFGVDQLGVVVLDVEVDRARRAALADHHVPAGELQLAPEVAARVRAGDGVGERPLGDDRVAPSGRRRGPGQRAGRDDEHVLGRERIRLRVHLLHEVPGGKAPAAQVGLRPLHVERFFGTGAGSEVNAQQSALPGHSIPP